MSNPTAEQLLPAERIALTVALAQLKRGEPATPNIAATCILGLARLAGVYDWTKVAETAENPIGPFDCIADETAT